jgi:catechol 2,3-dioxygenase-like lactoylglutathione lyase family enzyme
MTVSGLPIAHHIGYAVRSADKTAEAYTRLTGAQFRLMPPYQVKSLEGEPAELRVYYGAVAGSIIEIIETVKGNTPHSDWVKEHGDGIQHLGLYVDDVQAATREMLAKGGEIRWVYPSAGVVQLSLKSGVEDIMKETLVGSLTYIEPGVGGVILELLGPPINQSVLGGAVKGMEDLYNTSFPRV